ncbi:MAG: serine/threonine protein kinase [Acidobacteria bacterium]|nr:MAG: serine/threonine protein kinase [Acidobacteriota bacterium]
MVDPTQDRDRPNSASEPTQSVSPGSAIPILPLRRGTLFAERYRVLRKIGSGGTAEVHEVFDRVAGERRALKVLFPRPDDDGTGLERLRRELRAMHALRHPGIPRVFDIGEHGGLIYLVMELLRGESLRERLKQRNRLPVQEAVRILDGILDVLAAAHAEGIVHRDIKPENVFLVREPSGGERVAVLDFGLARRPGDLRMTATGTFLGTPAYASPEQARGEEPTPASDIYSAGVVLWRMLAGSTPFRGSSDVETLTAHVQQPLPSPRRSLAGAPRWLRDLAVAMLEKDPRRRPPDGRAALQRLRARRRTPLWRRAVRSAVRRPALRAGLASAAAAALLALALFPVRVGVFGTTIAGRSLLGIPVWRTDAPWNLGRWDVPLDPRGPWSRYHLLGLAQPKHGPYQRFPPEFPRGLLRVDLLTGRLDDPGIPRRLDVWRRGNPHGFPFVSPVMQVIGVARLPVGVADEPTGILAAWRHARHYPFAVELMHDDGETVLSFAHPGHLGISEGSHERPLVLKGDPPLLIFFGINNLLGSRSVVFAIDPTKPGAPAFPPFTTTMLVAPGRRAEYYTPLSRQGMLGPRLEDGALVVPFGERRMLRLDARTGVPLDPEDRGGLSASAWAFRRQELMRLLERAALARTLGDIRAAAAALEAYASGAEPARALAGVALARAAELRRESDDLRQGLRDAREAKRLEPLMPGHMLLEIDLLARLGAGRKEIDPLIERLVENGYADQLATAGFAYLLGGRTGKALAIFEHVDEGATGHTDWNAGLVAASAYLHDAEPERARVVIHDRSTYFARIDGRDPTFDFLAALAAVISDPPRPQEAAERLAPHTTGFGGGAMAPIVPLRALLAAWGAGPPVSDAAVDDALERQELEAKRSLRSLYWLAWARALAARAALEKGDRARFRRLAEQLDGSRGLGPWTERLLPGLRPTAATRRSPGKPDPFDG